MSRFVFVYRASGREQAGLQLPAEQLDAIKTPGDCTIDVQEALPVPGT